MNEVYWSFLCLKLKNKWAEKGKSVHDKKKRHVKKEFSELIFSNR